MGNKAIKPAAPAPAKAAAGGPPPPPPAPAPTPVAPELVSTPLPTSPVGVVVAPHIPAPIPPHTAPVPGQPKEAQPLAQGSLTEAQAEQLRQSGNPNIKAVAPPVPVAKLEQEKQGPLNEDGFVAGADVDPAAVLGFEAQRRKDEFARQGEREAKRQAAEDKR